MLADKVQIQQVLLNLIRNAIEAMEQSRPARTDVIVTAAADDDMVDVSVADTGPGIAPEIAAQLFQPFVTTKAQGMGVGLSICRTIIEAHGGQIWVEPNAGGGTVFRFTLRAVTKEDLAMPAEAIVHVIDDDEAVREFAGIPAADRADRRCGSSIRRGVPRQRCRTRAGCIVTDVRMPDMTGIELLRAPEGARASAAGHRHHRSWRRAACGRGDEGRRGRLHREAVRRRHAAAAVRAALRRQGGGRREPNEPRSSNASTACRSASVRC